VRRVVAPATVTTSVRETAWMLAFAYDPSSPGRYRSAYTGRLIIWFYVGLSASTKLDALERDGPGLKAHLEKAIDRLP